MNSAACCQLFRKWEFLRNEKNYVGGAPLWGWGRMGGGTVQIRLRVFWTTLSLRSIPVFWCVFFCGELLRTVDNWTIVTEVLWFAVVESSWNVMAHGDAWEGKGRGNWRMEWVASTLHTTSEHGVSSITTADAHTSAASSRLNWRPPPI